jgi:hypothetical protein
MSTEAMANGAQPQAKLEYVKPSFRTISLVAEEVMAVGCKLPASAGPNSGPGGTRCTNPAPCLQFNGVS